MEVVTLARAAAHVVTLSKRYAAGMLPAVGGLRHRGDPHTFAVFNRSNPAYQEAARDLGAAPWQTFRHLVPLRRRSTRRR